MSPPSVWMRFRQTLGRALRETGQALDRLGVQTAMLAATPHDYYDDPVIYQDHLSRHRQLFPLLWSGRPMIDANVAYIAPCATLIGSVRVHSGASIWYGAVLRADQVANANNEAQPSLDPDRLDDRTHHHGGVIVVGKDSNIQDSAIVTSRSAHCRVGQGVTVGHLAQIHSATVGDFCLVGMGSLIQEGAVVESEAFVAAGAVIAPNQVVQSGELWVGNPARKLRDLSQEERRRLHHQSSEYVKVASGQKDVMLLGGNIVSIIGPEDDGMIEHDEVSADVRDDTTATRPVQVGGESSIPGTSRASRASPIASIDNVVTTST